MWLLFVHYKIQSILISHKLVLETGYNNREFCMFVDTDPDTETGDMKFRFITHSAIQIEKPASYKYIEIDGNANIDLEDDIRQTCIDDIFSAVSDVVEIEQYIKTFKPITTTTYVKKQQGLRPRANDIEEEEEEGELSSDGETQGQQGQTQGQHIDIKDILSIPDLARSQVPAVRSAKTRRKTGNKRAENRHKPRTKKNLQSD